MEEEACICGVHLAPLKGMGDIAQSNVTPTPHPLRTVLKLSILQRAKLSETQDQDPNPDVTFRAYVTVPGWTACFC